MFFFKLHTCRFLIFELFPGVDMSPEESSDEDSLLSDSDNESISVRGKSTGTFLYIRIFEFTILLIKQ